MKRLIKFPSIDQFRTTVQQVQRAASFAGLDEAGEAIYNHSPDYPIVKAKATEKIHGTNAGVCFNEEDGFWVQSKENIIGGETGSDNAACAFHAQGLQSQWMEIIRSLAAEHNVNLNEKILTVYFEWCGGSVQKLSAVTGFDKMAMIFSYFKVSPKEPDPEETSVWYPTLVSGVPVANDAVNIFNIQNFPTYEFEINFSPAQALMSQNAMVDLVAKIEASSPVGEQFGKEGNVGEGIVVAFLYKNQLFQTKVKGELHANKATLKGLKVDQATENTILQFLAKENSTTFTYSFSTAP
jgi:hypothetical protein